MFGGEELVVVGHGEIVRGPEQMLESGSIVKVHRKRGIGGEKLVFGHLEAEGKLLFARPSHRFFGFAVGDVKRVDAGNGAPRAVDAHRDVFGNARCLVKNSAENFDDKVHRGKIVVEQPHAIAAGLFGMCILPFAHGRLLLRHTNLLAD